MARTLSEEGTKARQRQAARKKWGGKETLLSQELGQGGLHPTELVVSVGAGAGRGRHQMHRPCKGTGAEIDVRSC